mmetsp:Transcript_2553/g.5936  ORF Transcript_2553/g.5936 Transcript_2553/m.5936 type:complete len:208 (+) Transcript_2553:759-1382(+)
MVERPGDDVGPGSGVSVGISTRSAVEHDVIKEFVRQGLGRNVGVVGVVVCYRLVAVFGGGPGPSVDIVPLGLFFVFEFAFLLTFIHRKGNQRHAVPVDSVGITNRLGFGQLRDHLDHLVDLVLHVLLPDRIGLDLGSFHVALDVPHKGPLRDVLGRVAVVEGAPEQQGVVRQNAGRGFAAGESSRKGTMLVGIDALLLVSAFDRIPR